MSEHEQPQYQRRASDSAPGGSNGPSNSDIWKLLIEIQRDLSVVIQKQAEHATAFVVNDLGKPDLDGHRLYHHRSIKNAEQMDSYKSGMTKTAVDWATKGLLTLIVAGVLATLSIKVGVVK